MKRFRVILLACVFLAAMFNVFFLNYQGDIFLQFDDDIQPSDSPSSLMNVLDAQWINYVAQFETRLSQTKYCMMWCDQNDTVFSEQGEEEAEDYGYYVPYQKGTEVVTNSRCCQLVGRQDLEVLYDSRPTGFFNHEVTMVTIATYDRMSALRELHRRWKGHLIVVLYSTDHHNAVLNRNASMDVAKLIAEVERDQWENTFVIHYGAKYEKDQPLLREGVNFDRVFNKEKNLTIDLAEYPINTLRNIGMDYVKTRYVIANDIDLLPNVDLYDYVTKFAPVSELLREQDKALIIIPPFLVRKCAYSSWDMEEIPYPEKFTDLLDNLTQHGTVRPVYCDLDHWSQNYSQTFNFRESSFAKTCNLSHVHGVFNRCNAAELYNYPMWLVESNSKLQEEFLPPIEMDAEVMASDKEITRFEPYVVQSRVTMEGTSPRYNEVFPSRSGDKISYIAALRKLNFKFYTAPRNFLIHKEHEISEWCNKVSYQRMKEKAHLLFSQYLADLTQGRKI